MAGAVTLSGFQCFEANSKADSDPVFESEALRPVDRRTWAEARSDPFRDRRSAKTDCYGRGSFGSADPWNLSGADPAAVFTEVRISLATVPIARSTSVPGELRRTATLLGPCNPTMFPSSRNPPGHRSRLTPRLPSSVWSVAEQRLSPARPPGFPGLDLPRLNKRWIETVDQPIQTVPADGRSEDRSRQHSLAWFGWFRRSPVLPSRCLVRGATPGSVFS